MSPCGRVRAILVTLAHLYVVLTFPLLSERSSYFLPFPDCVLDLPAPAVVTFVTLALASEASVSHLLSLCQAP